MYNDEDLDHAVKRGIFNSKDVSTFRNFIKNGKSATLSKDEHIRFASGFNDVFVVAASILLLFSATYLSAKENTFLGAIALMVISWGLSEYFTKRRKLSLPSIVLVFSFVGGSIWLGSSLAKELLDGQREIILASGIFGAVMAFGHWLRFHVPITIACIIATVSYGLIGAAVHHWAHIDYAISSVTLAIGLIVLGFAIFWDASDRYRVSTKSDIAFWLHIISAPLIVHATFSLIDIFEIEMQALRVIIVLVLYLFLVLVSVSLDRRALMVSSLFYVLYVFANFFKDNGFFASSFAVTGILVGSSLLLLSAFWHKIRKVIISRYPEKISRFLPITG